MPVCIVFYFLVLPLLTLCVFLGAGPDVGVSYGGVPLVAASNGSFMHYARLGLSVGGGGVLGGPGGVGDGDDVSSMAQSETSSMVTSEM